MSARIDDHGNLIVGNMALPAEGVPGAREVLTLDAVGYIDMTLNGVVGLDIAWQNGEVIMMLREIRERLIPETQGLQERS